MARRRKPKNDLTDKLRAEIVTRFALGDGLAQVREWLATKGIERSDSSLEYYNGNAPAAYAAMSKKWRALFEERRKQYLEEARPLILERVHRARILERALERVLVRIERGETVNLALVDRLQSLLEQAAKEAGDMFTNRRLLEHTGKDGGPIQSESKISSDLAMLPIAELLKRRAELLRSAAEEAE